MAICPNITNPFHFGLIWLVSPAGVESGAPAGPMWVLWRTISPRTGCAKFGVFLQDFAQASGQDRICVFRKCFIAERLLNCLKGFESPWGYWPKI